MSGARVALADVSYRYPEGSEAVRGISLSFGVGQMVGLVGPNGAGKSTLIKLMNGLLRPRRGRVTLDGVDLASRSRREVAVRMAVVHQAPPLLFPYTVEETVSMGRWSRLSGPGWMGRRDREAVREAMELAGIAELAPRGIGDLSGGERQRVFLARALAQEADLLLLDEPVAHLDLRHQVEMLELLAGLHRGGGRGILMTLHDLSLAARYCRRLVVVAGGEVAADGTPAEVVNGPLLRRVFGVEALVDSDPFSGAPRITVGGVAPAEHT